MWSLKVSPYQVAAESVDLLNNRARLEQSWEQAPLCRWVNRQGGLIYL